MRQFVDFFHTTFFRSFVPKANSVASCCCFDRQAAAVCKGPAPAVWHLTHLNRVAVFKQQDGAQEQHHLRNITDKTGAGDGRH